VISSISTSHTVSYNSTQCGRLYFGV